MLNISKKKLCHVFISNFLHWSIQPLQSINNVTAVYNIIYMEYIQICILCLVNIEVQNSNFYIDLSLVLKNKWNIS